MGGEPGRHQQLFRGAPPLIEILQNGDEAVIASSLLFYGKFQNGFRMNVYNGSDMSAGKHSRQQGGQP